MEARGSAHAQYNKDGPAGIVCVPDPSGSFVYDVWMYRFPGA